MIGRNITAAALLVIGGLCGQLAWGETVSIEDGRYQLILDRNPFSLKDPPPPPAPPPPSNPPPVEVNLKLSGIALTPRGKFVYFVVPPTPGQNTEPTYMKLSEGEVQGEVEVVSVNYDEGEVTVVNAGQRAVLNLKDHAPDAVGPATTTGAPGARPGVPRPPGARPAVPVPNRSPGATPSAAVRTTTPSTVGGARTVIPSTRGPSGRSLPTPIRSGQTALSVGGGSRSVSYNRTVPARTVRTAPERSEPVDPAMQWLMLKAQEENARSQGLPAPPTPPMPGMQQ